MFLKEVPYAVQGYIYLITNIVNSINVKYDNNLKPKLFKPLRHSSVLRDTSVILHSKINLWKIGHNILYKLKDFFLYLFFTGVLRKVFI